MGCGATTTRLYPAGWWCASCRPNPNPVPDPALTLDGLRAAAGIALNTYPRCPPLRRLGVDVGLYEPAEPAPVGPAAQRVLDRAARVAAARAARLEDQPPSPWVRD